LCIQQIGNNNQDLLFLLKNMQELEIQYMHDTEQEKNKTQLRQ